MTTNNNSLKDLRARAANLVSAAGSLATQFQEEEVRLKRGDEVTRIHALRAAIIRDIKSVRFEETRAGYSHSQARAFNNLVGLGAALAAKASNNDGFREISDNLFERPANSKAPSGTVLVRIGPGGVPQDVHAVSVSYLARESGQDEFRVMEELKKAQNLLLDGEKFSDLIDRLADEILHGTLSLPISPRAILQMQTRLDQVQITQRVLISQAD